MRRPYEASTRYNASPVRMLKTILTVVIVAAALAAGAIALFWQALLTPEQKLKYGFTAAAAEDFRARLAAHPDNEVFAADYLDALVLEGNFGRAIYLADLYGMQGPRLNAVRPLLEANYTARSAGELPDVHTDPSAQELQDYPAYQALRYLEGYQHALSGDWHSAKNHLNAIEPKRLPAALKPYHTYYLARAYRLAGDLEEKGQVEELLTGLLAERDAPGGLKDMARGNLCSWFLSGDYPKADGAGRAMHYLKAMQSAASPWVKQRALTEYSAYSLEHGDYAGAWVAAQGALLSEPTGQAGKSAGMQLIAVLDAAIDARPEELFTSEGALLAPVDPGMFTALADSAAARGYTAEAVALLNKLKDHLTDRARWEELRVAMSECYRAAGDGGALFGLMEQANLAGLSDASMAEIYYNYARLLEQDSRWNDALRYYGYVSKLGDGRAGDAHFRAYAVLKHVQDPLDLAAAVNHLQASINLNSGEYYAKAVEELLPLLIWQGNTSGAGKLIDAVLGREQREIKNAEALATAEQLEGVAHYWQAYLADKAGDSASAQHAQAAIPLKYWNYYEICANYPPQPNYLPEAGCLHQPENAGEYFAGLGLDSAAAEFFSAEGDANNQLGLYLGLKFESLVKDLSGRQYAATTLLESGRVSEQALLEWVLAEAYPRPYGDEVAQAAAESGADPDLIYAIIKKESNFKENAESWVGAVGLMQVMPATARWLKGLYSLSLDPAKLGEPETNIRFGAAFLRTLNEQLDGKTRAVIHAYNGGAGNLEKWSERYGSDPVLLTELIPNEENEGFGKRVTRYYKVYLWLDPQSQAQAPGE